MGLTQLRAFRLSLIESHATGLNGKLEMIMPGPIYQVKNFIHEGCLQVADYKLPLGSPDTRCDIDYCTSSTYSAQVAAVVLVLPRE